MTHKIQFKRSFPIEDTMQFELCYEPELRLSKEEKLDIVSRGRSVWMLMNGRLMGETYGISPKILGEEIEDVEVSRASDIYCYSTTILPQYRGGGYGQLLKAYWLGWVATEYERVIGHATTQAALHLNEIFGARVIARHDRWYDTERSAWFYELPLA